MHSHDIDQKTTLNQDKRDSVELYAHMGDVADRYNEMSYDHESVLGRIEPWTLSDFGMATPLTGRYAQQAGGRRVGRMRALTEPNEDLQYIYAQIDWLEDNMRNSPHQNN